MEILINELKKRLPSLRISENEPMRNHCSFRIGGEVAAMAFPKTEGELVELFRTLKEYGIEPILIGNGTNLLVSDEKIDRFAIKLGEGFDAVREESGGVLNAECGISLARLAVKAREAGLSGLEFAHGIPGTLGGAVNMNAGAYGGEMKDVVLSVKYLDCDSGAVFEKSGAALDFGYRRSAFSGRNDIIISAKLRLESAEPADIGRKMNELAEKRRASQPLNLPSAGSTFKRPADGFAAAMIDECGLKGFSVGGAEVSSKHAGFVVNKGGASFSDVMAVIEHVRDTVLREKGVLLETEVKIIR